MKVVQIITMLALVLLVAFQQLELRRARAAIADLLAANDELREADQRLKTADAKLKTADDELKKSARRLARACGIEELP